MTICLVAVDKMSTNNNSFVNKASPPPVIEIDSIHSESTTSSYGNLSSIASASDKNMVDTTKATVLSVIIFFTIFGE